MPRKRKTRTPEDEFHPCTASKNKVSGDQTRSGEKDARCVAEANPKGKHAKCTGPPSSRLRPPSRPRHAPQPDDHPFLAQYTLKVALQRKKPIAVIRRGSNRQQMNASASRPFADIYALVPSSYLDRTHVRLPAHLRRSQRCVSRQTCIAVRLPTPLSIPLPRLTLVSPLPPSVASSHLAPSIHRWMPYPQSVGTYSAHGPDRRKSFEAWTLGASRSLGGLWLRKGAAIYEVSTHPLTPTGRRPRAVLDGHRRVLASAHLLTGLVVVH